MKNYYKILEVSPTADYKDIRDAFWRFSKMYHPDLHQQDKDFEDFFKEIQEAYEVLKNPARREEYDRQLRLFQQQQTPSGRIAFFVRNRVRSLKKADRKRESVHTYPPPKPIKTSRFFLLLLFVSVAVALVFYAENKFSENSLGNTQVTYHTERNEPEPVIIPEWEIPELPSAKHEAENRVEKEKKDEKKKETPELEKPDKEARKAKANLKPEPPLIKKATSLPNTSIVEEEETAAVSNKESKIKPEEKSEEKAAPTDKVYTEADKLPRFGGGSSAFVQYLKSNLQYPQDARNKGITGRVLVAFIVEKDGKVSNVSVVQGIGNGCDEEAVRVMKNAPAWIPGEEKGEKVRVQCTIPITFTLQ